MPRVQAMVKVAAAQPEVNNDIARAHGHDYD
jgi:hypothetical protein